MISRVLTDDIEMKSFNIISSSEFFLHGEMETNEKKWHPHLGLKLKNWNEFNRKISEDDRKQKVIFFLRHSEGIHNVAENENGIKLWEQELAKKEKYFDAALSEYGKSQALNESHNLQDELRRGLKIDIIITSPLIRTLDTATIVFNQTGIKLVANEDCRETIGVHTCDRRHDRKYLAIHYPNVDFSRIQDNEDTLWKPDHRETEQEIHLRAAKFIDYLYNSVEETHIAVVSHSGFIKACLDVVSHRKYQPKNCEFVPVVLQKIRKKDGITATHLFFLLGLLGAVIVMAIQVTGYTPVFTAANKRYRLLSPRYREH